jgi:hypothetical protein
MDVTRRQWLRSAPAVRRYHRMEDKPSLGSPIRIACSSASTDSTADMAAVGHAGGVHS